MLYLLLSILSSALIYMIFKLIPRFKVQTFPAIVFNYWVAFIFGLSLVDFDSLETLGSYSWKWLMPLEGILFITIFNVMALTVQKHSMAVGSVSSRTAMIIPAAVFMFYAPDAEFSYLKVLGIVLACVSVYLSTRKDSALEIDKRYLYLPLILFIGSGVIDLVIGVAQRFLMKDTSEITMFIPGVFLVAAIIGSSILAYRLIKGSDFVWQWKDAVAGFLLGLVNYASIYFIMNALGSGVLSDEVFFPVNHIGIIAVSTLFGLLLFKESLSRTNWLGIALGLVAMGLMTIAL